MSRQSAFRMRAGVELVAALAAIEGQGSNLLAALAGSGEIVSGRQYPDGGGFDSTSGTQYFFHVHAPQDVAPGDLAADEVGHIHCFIRPEGRADDTPLYHLVAIGLNNFGRPVSLFTTNRWVTCETWIEARAAARFARRFRTQTGGPADAFINAMFRLFRGEIADLLRQRDQLLSAWAKAHPDADTFEDHALQNTSSRRINLEGVLAGLRAELDE